MLKMIIADDESIVRKGLRNIFPWEEYGIEIIAESANGQEALDLCMQLKPDILFTDIRMPMMDGLEVAIKLREQGNDLKIIILSGAQDFNFAKTALAINAEGYITKPIKMNELKEVIKKVTQNISMERNREEKIQQLTKQLQENMLVMRDKFLRNLITGIYSNEQDIRDKLDYFKIPLAPDESVLVSVIQIDDYNEIIERYTEDDKQLLSFSVNNILDETVRNYNCGFSLLINENEFAVIFNYKSQINNKYMDVCEEISGYIKRFLDISVSIGLGQPVSQALQLSSSYKSAKVVLQYRFYSGKGSILSINDLNNIIEGNKNTKFSEYSNMYEAESRLINHVQLGDSAAVSEIIDEIFKILCSGEKVSANYIHYFCAEMISFVYRAIYELGESLDNIVAERSVILDKVYKTENVFDLQSYLTSLFTEITKYFMKKHKQKNSKIIEKIKKMIELGYKDDIDVKTISNEVYLSPNYISLIFKQETGESIIEYLTKVRMETAKELIKTTDMKISEISERVGYESQYYFSTVFKKYAGIHPTKYRTSTNS